MKEDILSSENSLNKNSFDNKDLINKQENNVNNLITEEVRNEDIIEVNNEKKESLNTIKLILVLLLFLLGEFIYTISWKIQKHLYGLGIIFEQHHFFPC